MLLLLLRPFTSRLARLTGLGQDEVRLLLSAAAFLFLAAALLLLPAALAERHGVREAGGRLADALQEKGADDDIILTLPSLKLFVWRGLLIGEHMGLHVCDLGQLNRVYLEFVDRRFGQLAWLRCEYRGGRVDSMPLVSKGRKRHINESLQPLWAHLADHYPDCMLGFIPIRSRA